MHGCWNWLPSTAKPGDGQRRVLKPLATLFGGIVQANEKDMYKVTDRLERSVAIAATLPGERERVCELITPPIVEHHQPILTHLLGCANDLGFGVPKEAAVHLHFDAKDMKNARVFCRMVDVFSRHGNSLKKLVKSNPNCRRMEKFHQNLLSNAASRVFPRLDGNRPEKNCKPWNCQNTSITIFSIWFVKRRAKIHSKFAFFQAAQTLPQLSHMPKVCPNSGVVLQSKSRSAHTF